MRYLNKYIIALSSLCIFATSCDVLDLKPTDRYSQDVVWGSEKSIDSYVVGFYSFMKESTEIYNLENFTDAYTDIIKSSSWDQYNHSFNKVLLLETAFSDTDAGAFDCWYSCYEEIRQDNEFLRDAPKYVGRFGEEFINTRMAEIRLVRAYAYFKLMRVYGYNDEKLSQIEKGGVIIRESLDGPNENNKARSSWRETWDFILEDIRYAAEHLPESWGGTKRFTKASAYAIMSRVALYAEDWDTVIEAANKCEELGCSLSESYDDIFKSASNKEHLFAIDFLSNRITHRCDVFFRPVGDSKYHSNMSIYGAFAPTSELVDAYEMADGSEFSWSGNDTPYEGREPRFYATILYNGATWEGRQLETYEGGADGIGSFRTSGAAGRTTTGYYLKKYITENDLVWETSGSSHFAPFIRYAEVILNKAEALAEKDWGANKDNALKLLNSIRERVDLPEKSANTLEEFRQILQKERMIEFAGEGLRYWDLRRWRIAEEVINGKSAHGCQITKTGDAFTYKQVEVDAGLKRVFFERYYSYSIPIVERSNNTSLGMNNPGW